MVDIILRSPLIYISLKTLNDKIKKILYRELSFDYKKMEFTPRRKPRVTIVRRNLYKIMDNILICQKGFLDRVFRIFADNNIKVKFRDETAVTNPAAYIPHWDNIKDANFRPKQKECLEIISKTKYGGVIEAPPAFGKTFLISLLCALYKDAKIDIVTKRRDVCATISSFLAERLDSVGQVGGGKRNRARITVYTADSLHHSDFSADFLLADEAHELMTDRYAKLLSSYQKSRNFAFTATPDTRFDGASFRLEALFGPKLFSVTYDVAEQNNLVVPITIYWVPVRLDYNPAAGVDHFISIKRRGIWNNYYRNQIIADIAMAAYRSGKQVLVLVETVEHLKNLSSLLPDFKVCYATGTEGAMPKKDREKLRKAFEQRKFLGAIATGVWAVGVSFESLEVLIRAEGTASDTDSFQKPGRVCRIHSGKSCGIVVDFIDSFDRRLYRRSLARNRAYEKYGWKKCKIECEELIELFSGGGDSDPA